MTKAKLETFLRENFKELTAKEINNFRAYGLKFTNSENQYKNWIESQGLMPEFKKWFKQYPGKNETAGSFLLFLNIYEGGELGYLFNNDHSKKVNAKPFEVGYQYKDYELPKKNLLIKLGFTIIECEDFSKPFTLVIYMDAKNNEEYSEALKKYAEALEPELAKF